MSFNCRISKLLSFETVLTFDRAHRKPDCSHRIDPIRIDSPKPPRQWHLPTPYLEAGLPVCEAANSFCRASSKAAQSLGSSTDLKVTVSRRSRPARAA